MILKLITIFSAVIVSSILFLGSKLSTLKAKETNYWVQDNHGIKTTDANYNVGIKTNSDGRIVLNVNGDVDGVEEGNAGMFYSNSTWHTALAIKNNSSYSQFTFLVAGENNKELLPNNFGICNGNYGTSRFSMVVDAKTNNVGFGYNSTITSEIPSAVTIYNGDIHIDQVSSGIILKSPNGQKWRITIDNNGNFIRKKIKLSK